MSNRGLRHAAMAWGISMLSSASLAGASASPSIAVGQEVRSEIESSYPLAPGAIFELTASFSGPVTIEAASLEFDPFLKVSWTDAPGLLGGVRMDNDLGPGTSARVVLDVVGGARYRVEVQVNGVTACGGSFTLTVRPGAPKPLEADSAIEVSEARLAAVKAHARERGTPACEIHARFEELAHIQSLWAMLLLPRTVALEKQIILMREALDLAGSALEPLRIGALSLLGWALGLSGNAKQDSENLLGQALALAEAAYGTESLTYGGILSILGRVTQGAEKPALLERAYEAKAAALGEDHPVTALALVQVGNTPRPGEQDETFKKTRRGLEILERTAGPDHPLTAIALDYLGGNVWVIAETEEMFGLRERAVAIMERVYGPDHPAHLLLRKNLGVMYGLAGRNIEALHIFERSYEAARKILEADDPRMLNIVHNLVRSLINFGDLERAKVLIDEYLALAERIEGKRRDGILTPALDLRGKWHAADGDVAAARKAFEKAREIESRTTSPEDLCLVDWSPNFDLMHGRLAAGAPDLALEEAARCLPVVRKSMHPDHPHVGALLEIQAKALLRIGRARESAGVFEEAIRIREATYGVRDSILGGLYLGLARARLGSGSVGAAIEAALSGEASSRVRLRMVAEGGSDRLALRYAESRSTGLDLLLSLAGEPEAPPGSLARVLDAVVRSRALVLDEAAARNRMVYASSDPEIRRLGRDVVAARERLARVALRPSGGDAASHTRLIESLSRTREKAENALAERSAAFRLQEGRLAIGWEDVRSALPAGSALVSFARHHRGDEPVYAVFVVPSSKDEPYLVSLGSADTIDAAVARWRKVAGDPSASGQEREALEAGEALRRLVWDRASRGLSKASRVFVVPDGSLHLLNLAALPAADGSYLVESGPTIHYLSAERDLVRPERDGPAPADGLLAIGGAAFDARGVFGAGRATLQTAAGAFRGPRSACPTLSEMRFVPLPETGREISEVARLWERSGRRESRVGAVRLVGPAATEGAFKALAPGKEVLHLATHGYFLGKECAPALPGSRAFGAVTVKDAGSRPAAQDVDPLLLAGLGLAGANHRAEAGPDEDDGILTAQEIAAMDLSSSRWVVLSACETGLGEVQSGEGVLGLRRAFEIAGTGTLIMSLWTVEDESTRRWMRYLYEARFNRLLDTSESVRQASLSALKDLRARGRSTHPFLWAGFVAAGDWR